jgi:hypothetical protein
MADKTVTIQTAAGAIDTKYKDMGDGTFAQVLSSGGATTSPSEAEIGAVNETAPATDTASSGLNGRLQRIAQRLTTLLPAGASGVAVPVGNKTAVLSASPTLDTSAYASGDCLHTSVISFANAVAVSGGTGTIVKLTVIDADLQSAAGELWLFSATVTPAAANAAHSISDGDAALCVGVIPFGPYYASALNSVSVNSSISLPFSCAATTLFAIAVTRGTPTYTASGLTIKLLVAQD